MEERRALRKARTFSHFSALLHSPRQEAAINGERRRLLLAVFRGWGRYRYATSGGGGSGGFSRIRLARE